MALFQLLSHVKQTFAAGCHDINTTLNLATLN